LGIQLSGQNRLPIHPSNAATAKKMIAAGIKSSTPNAPAMSAPPRCADSPAVPMPMPNSLVEPEDNFAKDHHGER
jgi:hypothetical protein